MNESSMMLSKKQALSIAKQQPIYESHGSDLHCRYCDAEQIAIDGQVHENDCIYVQAVKFVRQFYREFGDDGKSALEIAKQIRGKKIQGVFCVEVGYADYSPKHETLSILFDDNTELRLEYDHIYNWMVL